MSLLDPKNIVTTGKLFDSELYITGKLLMSQFYVKIKTEDTENDYNTTIVDCDSSKKRSSKNLVKMKKGMEKRF